MFGAFKKILAVMFMTVMGCNSVAATTGYVGEYDSARSWVIVFVNSLISDEKAAWTNRKSGAYWPSILRNDPSFDEANIYVYGRNSPPLLRASISELTKHLYMELEGADVLSHKNIVFVAHSMGGLVVKDFVLRSNVFFEVNLKDQIALIYFAGVPSKAGSYDDWKSILPDFAGERKVQQIIWPESEASFFEAQNKRWKKLSKGIVSVCASENRKEKLSNSKEIIDSFFSDPDADLLDDRLDARESIVVDELSAYGHCSYHFDYDPIGDSHTNMVRPNDINSPINLLFKARFEYVRRQR